jgi:membrane associated rhomboid family serine protease
LRELGLGFQLENVWFSPMCCCYWFLGRLVESQLETANFILLLVATAVSGAVIDTLFRARNFTAIGSSGMVFGLIGALLSFYILGRVPLSRWALVRRLSILGGLSC